MCHGHRLFGVCDFEDDGGSYLMKERGGRNGIGEKKQDFWSKFLFLAVVVGLYVIFFLAEPSKTIEALSFAQKVFGKLWPVLIFVFLLMFVVNLLVRPRWIRRHVGHDSGGKGFWVALVGGIISVGPIYIWYAMLKDFQEKGMRPALIAVFLYSRAVKIPLLPLMVFYFGITYTVVLTFYLLVFAVLSGICTEALVTEHKTFQTE